MSLLKVTENFQTDQYPPEWVSTLIADVAPLQRGFDLPSNKLVNGKYPVVYSNGIIHYHHCYIVKGPGVVTGRSGTLGKVHYIEEDFWPHNTSLWVTNFKGNYPKFVFYLFSFIGFERFTSGSGVPTLNRNDAHDFIVSLPPLPEQRAIAEALSDADALIDSLERLIAKKRAIRQGAMQQLLTGQRRLPGFSGEWKIMRLGDSFFIKAGGDLDTDHYSPTQNDDYPYPIYSNGLSDKGLYGFSSKFDYSEGTITVTARGTLGVANYRDHKYCAIGRVLNLIPILNLDIRFISNYINNQIEFVHESTGVPQLTAPQAERFEIRLPTFSEQTAIAEVLSDMDAEIDALSAKLSKARTLKQGMMQQLLTGRIRLC